MVDGGVEAGMNVHRRPSEAVVEDYLTRFLNSSCRTLVMASLFPQSAQEMVS